MKECFYCGEPIEEPSHCVTARKYKKKVHKDCDDLGDDYWKNVYTSWGDYRD